MFSSVVIFVKIMKFTTRLKFWENRRKRSLMYSYNFNGQLVYGSTQKQNPRNLILKEL